MVDQLTPAARRFLARMDEQRSDEFDHLLEMFERMTPGAQMFLERADPHTLAWLVRARPEEIAQLEEGIGLVRASRTVGKFTKWAIISMISGFVAAFTLGEWIVRLYNIVRGVH